MKKQPFLTILLFMLLFTVNVSAKECKYKNNYVYANVTTADSKLSYEYGEIFYNNDSMNLEYKLGNKGNYVLQESLDKAVMNVSNNFFGNLDVVRCGNAEIPAPLAKITRIIFMLIKIATPLALIIMGMIDMVRAVTAGDEKKIKENQGKFVKRLISAALVYFVVSIVQFLISIVADNGASVVECINCLVNDSSKCTNINRPVTPPVNPPTVPDEGLGTIDKNEAKSYISSIKNDGVIVTIKAKNKDGIKGYYFSYDDELPDKGTGGYIETSDTTLEVVRLVGTTYVWVENDKGKVNGPKK